jgi:hypothetical protein
MKEDDNIKKKINEERRICRLHEQNKITTGEVDTKDDKKKKAKEEDKE